METVVYNRKLASARTGMLKELGIIKARHVLEYDHVTADDIRACLAYASEMLKTEKVYLLPRTTNES